jgi:hypothetical protein
MDDALTVTEEQHRIYINNMACPSCGRLIHAISPVTVGGVLELSISHSQGMESTGLVVEIVGRNVPLLEGLVSRSALCRIRVRSSVLHIAVEAVVRRSDCDALIELENTVTIGQITSRLRDRKSLVNEDRDSSCGTMCRELACFRYSPPRDGGECLRCGQSERIHVPSCFSDSKPNFE